MVGRTQRGRWVREEVVDAVEALGVEEADDARGDTEHREPDELARVGQVVPVHVAKERSEPLDAAPQGVADDRGDERGQQGLDLEVVAVENLGGEDGPGEGRAEDRPDARADAARDREARVAR